MAGRSPFSDPLQGQGSAGDSGGDSDSDISGVVDDATTYRRITGPTSTVATIAAAPTTTATLHASAGAGVGAGAGSSATVARSDPKAAVATSTTAAAAAATTQSAASSAFTGVDVTQQPPAISAAYLAVLASTRCSVTAPSVAELVALLQKATQTAGVDVARTADWQWECSSTSCLFALSVFAEPTKHTYTVEAQLLQGGGVAFSKLYSMLVQALGAGAAPASYSMKAVQPGTAAPTTVPASHPPGGADTPSSEWTAQDVVTYCIKCAQSPFVDVRESGMQSLLGLTRKAKLQHALVEHGAVAVALAALEEYTASATPPAGVSPVAAIAVGVLASLLCGEASADAGSEIMASRDGLRALLRCCTVAHDASTAEIRRAAVFAAGVLLQSEEHGAAAAAAGVRSTLEQVARTASTDTMRAAAAKACGSSGAATSMAAAATTTASMDSDYGSGELFVEPLVMRSIAAPPAPPVLIAGYPLSKFTCTLPTLPAGLHATIGTTLQAEGVDTGESHDSPAWTWDCYGSSAMAASQGAAAGAHDMESPGLGAAGGAGGGAFVTGSRFAFQLRVFTKDGAPDIVIDFQHLQGDLFAFASCVARVQKRLTKA